MRIIKPARILEFSASHPEVREPLQRWLKIAKVSRWGSLLDVRNVFRNADEVVVKSGRPVVIFNIGGNKYRLITAIHYNRSLVYVMIFLTHAEYSKEVWKRNL